MYRQLEEDTGMVVFVASSLKDFVEKSYERLLLPHSIIFVEAAGEKREAYSVFSVSVDKNQKQAVLSTLVIGEDAQDVLKQGEFVTGIYLPFLAPNSFSAYYKVGKRKALAIAIASLAVMLQLNSNGTVEKIKLVWGSLGPTVMILPEVENFLKGKVLSDKTLSQAGEMAALGVLPINDIRASAEYRRRLAANLLFRLCSESDFRKG